MAPVLEQLVRKLVVEVARDDVESKLLAGEIEIASLKDPVRLHEKASDEFERRFADGQLAEACAPDVTRCRLVLQTGHQIRDLIARLITGVQLGEGGLVPTLPSERAAIEAEAAESQATTTSAAGGGAGKASAGGLEGRREGGGGGEPPPLGFVTHLELMGLANKFEQLDPTHFRSCVCSLKLTHKGVSFFCEVEVHHSEILSVAVDYTPEEHYHYFRRRLKGQFPEAELDAILEEKLVFLVDATGIPVLLSLLVLIFTAGGEDLTRLPSNRIELYELGIESAITKRLLPTGFSSTDMLVNQWLRLFNLDRSAITVTPTVGQEQKKEREHRPTRKAALSMEHSIDREKLAEEAAAMAAKSEAKTEAKGTAKKKSGGDAGGQANKTDNKKILSLDSKEVYEVFRHGAHYLREAVKPEVQRTELNKIELSMPKKLVDTVMMLVNANLKTLLNGRAQAMGLVMLRQVAVANQEAGRREFASGHVSKAMLIDQVNTEGFTLWLHLNKEEAGIPLTKTLEAQTEVGPAQYQFKHLSFQEGLYAQNLLIQAEAGWEGWETDSLAAAFLNNPFMNNTCRIASGYLGMRLATRRPVWDFSAKDARLSDVGLQALWLICEKNGRLKTLKLRSNSVGSNIEDGPGISKMLITSTALETLDLGSNHLGELKMGLRAIGRGLAANKSLTFLNLSSNGLYPDGTKAVCNSLRTCTSLKVLDLSFNSPGREAALANMIQMHPALRSIGVVEKEPQTRTEKTCWLDNRAKEAIGRALLDSPGTCMFLQCDAFSLKEDTTTLPWTSKLSCDAVVLAGVLRSNTVLRTINVGGGGGELDDYNREQIGEAILSNTQGTLGYCDIYGLKEGMNPAHTVDLKDKEQIRSRRSFTLFCGLLRANTTLTSLTIVSAVAEHIEWLAKALATNNTLLSLRLDAPNKAGETMTATLPVQQLNGSLGVKTIDLSLAGGPEADGGHPTHRWANALIGEILNTNSTIVCLKLNPGSLADGGTILTHIHRARKSSLRTLDLTGIGLSDRGGGMFFDSLLEGKCKFLTALHMGDNQLTDAAVGQLIVETMRDPMCNVATLDVHNNILGAPVVTQAIRHNRSLTSLNISGNPIDDDGLNLLGDVLLDRNCNCSINSILCDSFEIPLGSKELKIHGGALQPGAVKLLCGVVKYNALIEALDLSGRGIATNAASMLATALKANKTITSLDLSSNPLTDVSLYGEGSAATSPDTNPLLTRPKAAKADTKGLVGLAEALKLNTSLSAITLESAKGSTLPIETLKGYKSSAKGDAKGDTKARVVDLARKGLSFISAIFVGIFMRGNPHVTELVLSSNDLTPVGATAVLKQLSKSVKVLDISNIVSFSSSAGAGSKADKKSELAARKAAGSTASTSGGGTIPPSQLASLWAAVSALGVTEKLDRLIVDRNQLTVVKSFGQLTSLKTLSLSHNFLAVLPEDIRCIAGLKTLTLHNNQLRELPEVIGELEALERVDLRSNLLTSLPYSLAQLKNLKLLDASENLIQTLHPSICDLHAVERVELRDNPMARPPIAVARNGIGAIRKYFQEILLVNEMFSYGARLVMLGHTGCGKTSLQRSLRAGSTSDLAGHHESTSHVDIHSVAFGEGAKQVSLSIWDLAGHVDYAPTIQPAIVEGALYVLAVPCLDVHTLQSTYADLVGRWLDYLATNAPNAVVLPVLTKCDLLIAKGDKGAPPESRTPSAYQAKAAAQHEWLTKRLEASLLSPPAHR